MERSSTPSSWEHLKAGIQLPFVVIVIVPALIQYFMEQDYLISIKELAISTTNLLGIILLISGLVLFVLSIDLFIKIGNGTLAPWNPTKKLVVKGLYRHVRNPMLIGVNLILMGEGFLFRSSNILLWALFFLILNHLYFMFKEEPGLAERFGAEYLEYQQKVPRWIPRIKAWRPEEEQQ